MEDKYKYAYEKTANYCYKNSDVLINKLNITNDKDLYDAERELVSYRISELEEKPLKSNFDFDSLKQIHKYFFQDIYRWAGDIRNCNIAKKDLFCLSEFIERYASSIFNKLKEENYYLNYDYNITVTKLAELFADINALHPFREGNGRTQRFFIESLAKINGIDLNFENITKEDMIIASHESINGDMSRLSRMFYDNSKKILQDKQKEYIKIYCTPSLSKKLLLFLK